MNDSLTYLDGNAAAGELGEIFAMDVTAAAGQCAGCGRTAVLADVRVYVRAPGTVGRCRGCDAVLFRLVRAPGRAWLDLSGLTYLQLTMPDDA